MNSARRLALSFATNLGLLLVGATMVVSGFAMQFGYHMGHHGTIDADHVCLGMAFPAWSATHKTSIIVVSVLVVVHVVLHWAWFRALVRKRLFAKHRLVVCLSILFAAAAVTGYLPWLLALTGQPGTARKTLIEVHDKLTLALSLCLVVHVARRARWFVAVVRRGHGNARPAVCRRCA